MNDVKFKHAATGVLVAIVLFAAGFFAGERSPSRVASKFLNATSSEKIDLEPFWRAWGILDEKFSPASSTNFSVSEQDKVWGAIQGLAQSYDDPYTVFFPPSESKAFEEEISGSFGGVGMEIGIQNGQLTVIAPLKNTPADRAGVKPGDKVVKIGDVDSINLSTDEAISLIRGEIGTPVTVTFAREGVLTPIVKTLIRESIEIPTVSTKITPENVFVIELYNFSATSPNLFRGALRKFVESGSDKLVIDLRNNPGGYLEAALDMSSWFLPSGKLVVSEDFGGKREPNEYRSKGYDIFNEKLKMAILVNNGSASASEIFAGAMQEYGKAVLVGEKTFGKGSVQELVPVTDDTSLKITVAHWFTPNGKSISSGGLSPDIPVKLTPENTKDGRDPAFDTAVKYLVNKK